MLHNVNVFVIENGRYPPKIFLPATKWYVFIKFKRKWHLFYFYLGWFLNKIRDLNDVTRSYDTGGI